MFKVGVKKARSVIYGKNKTNYPLLGPFCKLSNAICNLSPEMDSVKSLKP